MFVVIVDESRSRLHDSDKSPFQGKNESDEKSTLSGESESYYYNRDEFLLPMPSMRFPQETEIPVSRLAKGAENKSYFLL